MSDKTAKRITSYFISLFKKLFTFELLPSWPILTYYCFLLFCVYNSYLYFQGKKSRNWFIICTFVIIIQFILYLAKYKSLPTFHIRIPYILEIRSRPDLIVFTLFNGQVTENL